MVFDHFKFLLKIQSTCTNTVPQQEFKLNSMLKNNKTMMKNKPWKKTTMQANKGHDFNIQLEIMRNWYLCLLQWLLYNTGMEQSNASAEAS